MGQKNRRVPKSGASSTGSQTPSLSASNTSNGSDSSPKARSTKAIKPSSPSPSKSGAAENKEDARAVAIAGPDAPVAKNPPTKEDAEHKGLGFKSYQNGTLKTDNFKPMDILPSEVPRTPAAAVPPEPPVTPKLNAKAAEFTPRPQQPAIVPAPTHQIPAQQYHQPQERYGGQGYEAHGNYKYGRAQNYSNAQGYMRGQSQDARVSGPGFYNPAHANYHHGGQAYQQGSGYSKQVGYAAPQQFYQAPQEFGPQDFPVQEYYPAAHQYQQQQASPSVAKIKDLIRSMPPPVSSSNITVNGYDAFPRFADGTQVDVGYALRKRSSPPPNAPTAPASMRRPKTFLRRADVGRKDIIISGPDLIRNLVRVTKFYTPDGSLHEEMSDEFHPNVYDFAADLKTLSSRDRRHYYRDTEVEICIDVAAENAEGGEDDNAAVALLEGPKGEENDAAEVRAPMTPEVVASSMAQLEISDPIEFPPFSEAAAAASLAKEKGKAVEVEKQQQLVVHKANILSTLRDLDGPEFEFSHSITSVTVVLNFPLNYINNSRSSPVYKLITALVDVLQTFTNMRHLDVVLYVPEDRTKRDLLDVRQVELVLPFYDLGFTDWRLMFQLPYMSAPEEVTGWIISHLDLQMKLIMQERDRVLHRSHAQYAVAPRPQSATTYRVRRRPTYNN